MPEELKLDEWLERLERNDPRDHTIDFSREEPTEEDIGRIARILHANPHLTSLDLSRTHLTDDQAEKLAGALHAGSPLTQLNISYNRLSPSAIEAFAIAIGTHGLSLNLISDNQYLPPTALEQQVGRLLTTTPSLHEPEQSAENIKHDLEVWRHEIKNSAISDTSVVRKTTLPAELLKRLDENDPTLTTVEISSYQLNAQEISKLAEALEENSVVTNLCLANNRISDLGSLIRVLTRNEKITTLDLSHNEINDEGAQLLDILLRINPSLTAIDLSDNRISPLGVTALATALRDNHSLKTLRFANHQLGDDGIIQLVEPLLIANRTLENLDLSGNHIQYRGTLAIANVIAANQQLQIVDLSNNEIWDQEIEELTKLLHPAISLTTLNLSGNRITPAGVHALQGKIKTHNLHHRLGLKIDSQRVFAEDLETPGTASASSVAASIFTFAQTTTLSFDTFLQKIRSNDETYVNLRLSGLGIGEEKLLALTEAIKENTQFVSIDLSDNLLATCKIETLKNFSNVLANHPRKLRLNLAGNKLDANGITAFTSLFNGNDVLRELNISGNQFEVTTELLKAMKTLFRNNPGLLFLDLSDNHLGDAGIVNLEHTKISYPGRSLLNCMLHLPHLSLSNNGLSGMYMCLFEINLLENKTLESLDLSHNPLANQGIIDIREGLIPFEKGCLNRTLTVLNLSNCQLYWGGASKIASILRFNKLTYLNLSDNALHVGHEELIAALKENKDLTTLDLSNTGLIDEAVFHLAGILALYNFTLTHLLLADNRLGYLAVYSLAHMLQRNKTLTYLDLQNNDINDLSMRDFVHVLRDNQTLSTLLLKGNWISEAMMHQLKTVAAHRGARLQLDSPGQLSTQTNRRSQARGTVALALSDVSLENNATIDLPNCPLGVQGAYQLTAICRTNQNITELNLQNCALDNLAIKALEWIYYNGKLSKLILINNQVGVEGTRFLSGILARNETITHLDLSQNPIEQGGATALAKALGFNRVLKQLILVRASLDNKGAEQLAKALYGDDVDEPDKMPEMLLSGCWGSSQRDTKNEDGEPNTSLERLDLSYNSIGHSGMQAITKMLSRNRTLTDLNLAHNKILGLDTKHLAEALQHNTTLQFLNLAGNFLDDEAICAIGIAVWEIDNHPLTLFAHLNLCSQQSISRPNRQPSPLLGQPGLFSDLPIALDFEQETAFVSLLRGLANNQTSLRHLDSNNEFKSDEGAERLVAENKSSLIDVNLVDWAIENENAYRLAAVLSGNTVLQSLTMKDCRMKDEGICALLETLAARETTLIDFNLSGNCIGVKGIKHLAMFLNNMYQAQRKFKRFSLAKNRIAARDMKMLAGGLVTCAEELDLSENLLMDAGMALLVGAIARAGGNHFKALILRSVGITPRGVKLLATVLVDNPTPLRLDLSYNVIGNAGVRALTSQIFAGLYPLNINSLHLEDCHIDDAGVELLVKTVKKEKCLQTLNLARNLFTHDGYMQIANLLIHRNETLTSLDLSHNSPLRGMITRLVLSLSTNRRRIPLAKMKLEMSDLIQDKFINDHYVLPMKVILAWNYTRYLVAALQEILTTMATVSSPDQPFPVGVIQYICEYESEEYKDEKDEQGETRRVYPGTNFFTFFNSPHRDRDQPIPLGGPPDEAKEQNKCVVC